LALWTVVIVVAVLAVGVPVLFTYVRMPGELLDGALLLDDEADVYLEVTLRREDPGARELLRGLLESRSRAHAAAFRFAFFKLTSRNLKSVTGGQVSEKDLDRLLPVTLVLSRGGEETAPVLAISYPVAANSLRLFGSVALLAVLPAREVDRLQHQGQDYFRIDTEPSHWLALPGSTVLVSRHEGALQTRLDRLRDAPAAPAAAFRDLVQSMPADAAVRLLARDGAALTSLVRAQLPAVAAGLRRELSQPRPVTLWLRIEPGGDLSGELGIDCGAGAGASPPGDGWTLSDRGVRVELVPLQEPGRCARAWSVRASGVPRLIATALPD
jgi:hypothetical protein